VLTAMGSLIDNKVTLNLATLTVLQKNLQGTIFGGSNPYYDIPHLLSMYKVGKLNLDGMVTKPVPIRGDQRRLSRHAGEVQHSRNHPVHRRGPLRPSRSPPPRRPNVTSVQSAQSE